MFPNHIPPLAFLRILVTINFFFREKRKLLNFNIITQNFLPYESMSYNTQIVAFALHNFLRQNQFKGKLENKSNILNILATEKNVNLRITIKKK